MLAALEAACHARLLEEEGEDVYHFAHDVIREVIEADLGAARRTMLHRCVAEALEAGPGEPAVELLAYHYARSDAQDKAVRYLEQAGDKAAAQHANAAAEGYYRELVDRLDRLGRSLGAAHVREKLGTVLMTAGHYDAALELVEQAAETYHAAGDLERWGGALAQMGHLYTLSDRIGYEAGVARLQPFVACLESHGASRGIAMLHAVLADLYWGTGRLREGLVAAGRAAEYARAVGDDRLLGTAEQSRASLLGSMVGHQEEALRVFEEARRAAEVAGDLETLWI